MALQKQLGQKGEQMAVDYLVQHEFSILHRNWRYSRYEIDIIAEKSGKLHFVEVKLRSYPRFGMPEEKVKKRKFRKVLKAADEFLYHHRQYKYIQFDILAITLRPNREPDYFYIQDIYW